LDWNAPIRVYLQVPQKSLNTFFDRNSPKALRAAIEEAVVRKEKGGARFTKPKEYLKYDPTIEKHIESLLKVLRENRS